jgi:ubiquinone/menaquinone biosynthesis C-methylase UbiE
MAERVCPWWMGYMLLIPFRKFNQNPKKILKPYIKPGMNILEIGPGMGFFSIPMAEMTGEKGKIIAIDIQEKMLTALNKRAKKFNVDSIIETRLCPQNSFGIDDLEDKVDFALAFAVVHEIPDTRLLFKTILRTLKPGGTLLISEPSGHVTIDAFKITTDLAIETGFTVVERPVIKGGHSVLLKK